MVPIGTKSITAGLRKRRFGYVRRFSLLFSMLIFGLGELGLAQAPSAQTQTPTPTPMGFTSAQAEQGAAIYQEACVGCHGQSLTGSGGAPALSGATFLSRWRPKMVSELSTEIHQTMPPNQPGSLSEDYVSALTAFILQQNGAAASTHTLKGGDQAPIGTILSAAPTAGPAPATIDVEHA
jgi:mono/diheme cytochrome c family protein